MAVRTESYVNTSALIAYADKSGVDAVGLHLMAERRIKSCWSTDFHLSLTGVTLLIHER
jgi:hypothetical protein